MAKNLYVSAAEPFSGKVLVSLGIMGMLERNINRLGFFRPTATPYRVTESGAVVLDRDIFLMHEVFGFDCRLEEMYGATTQEAAALIAESREPELHERVLAAYKRLEESCDFVLCEGTDFLSATTSVEADFNSRVARDLSAPVALVVDGSSDGTEALYSKAMIGVDSFRDKSCQVLGVFLNKIPVAEMEHIASEVLPRLKRADIPLTACIPYDANLAMPSMRQVAAHLNGEALFGRKHLHNKVGKTIVASGSVETIIKTLDNRSLLVTHVDRHDVIMMTMVSLASLAGPNIAGVVLSGKEQVAKPVMDLLRGLPGPRVPIVSSGRSTYETVIALRELKPTLEPGNVREIEIARQQFETHVDTEALAQAIRLSAPSQVTPLLFKYELVRRARADRKHVVLPEGNEERILKATDALLRLKAVDITLLGNPDAIRNQAGQLSVDLDGAHIVDPQNCDWNDEFSAIYHKLRAHKGMTLERAREAVTDPPLFGTLMVHTGRADGMVSGATHSTARTILPAFQVIKTRKGVSIVSSVFFMCLEDRVLVYGDCAVNPDPDAQQLAEIAVSSADTARAFNIEPIVAMLSYSTGESGQGADVDKVKEAVLIARKLRPELLIEGPLQYDAAVEPTVARQKLPGSKVAGRATVFVFPDLNTGNNTYKAVQRSAHAVAVGPVLQGLNKPVNDLSRGCLVEDIFNTVAITAIQAQ